MKTTLGTTRGVSGAAGDGFLDIEVKHDVFFVDGRTPRPFEFELSEPALRNTEIVSYCGVVLTKGRDYDYWFLSERRLRITPDFRSKKGGVFQIAYITEASRLPVVYARDVYFVGPSTPRPLKFSLPGVRSSSFSEGVAVDDSDIVSYCGSILAKGIDKDYWFEDCHTLCLADDIRSTGDAHVQVIYGTSKIGGPVEVVPRRDIFVLPPSPSDPLLLCPSREPISGSGMVSYSGLLLAPGESKDYVFLPSGGVMLDRGYKAPFGATVQLFYWTDAFGPV